MTDRINLLAADVYDYVFSLLDNEPEIAGGLAGKIATALEKEFKRMLEDDDEETSQCIHCGGEAYGYEECPDCEWANGPTRDID